MVMGGDSCSKGRGFKYWHHIVDGLFTNICCKNCNEVCMKRPKINCKRGRGWPIFLKKTLGSTFIVLYLYLTTLEHHVFTIKKCKCNVTNFDQLGKSQK